MNRCKTHRYTSILWNKHTVSIPHPESGRICAKMQFMPCWMYFSWPRGKNHTKFTNRHAKFDRRYSFLLICLFLNSSTIAQLIERQPFLISLKQAPWIKTLREFKPHDRHNRLFCFISQCEPGNNYFLALVCFLVGSKLS